MERKQIGLARQTKRNGKICAAEEIGNRRAAVRGGAETAARKKTSGEQLCVNVGLRTHLEKRGSLLR